MLFENIAYTRTHYKKPRQDEILFPGIDYGSPHSVLFENGNILITKVQGHTAWSGRFLDPDYYPTRYFIIHINPDHTASLLKEQQFGLRWKTGLKTLIEEALALCALEKIEHDPML
jgi:hypothetical protein